MDSMLKYCPKHFPYLYRYACGGCESEREIEAIRQGSAARKAHLHQKATLQAARDRVVDAAKEMSRYRKLFNIEPREWRDEMWRAINEQDAAVDALIELENQS